MGKWPGLNNDSYYFQVLSSVPAFSQSELRVNTKNPMRRLRLMIMIVILSDGNWSVGCTIVFAESGLLFDFLIQLILPSIGNRNLGLITDLNLSSLNSHKLKDFSLHLHNDHLCKMLNPPIPDQWPQLCAAALCCDNGDNNYRKIENCCERTDGEGWHSRELCPG